MCWATWNCSVSRCIPESLANQRIYCRWKKMSVTYLLKPETWYPGHLSTSLLAHVDAPIPKTPGLLDFGAIDRPHCTAPCTSWVDDQNFPWAAAAEAAAATVLFVLASPTHPVSMQNFQESSRIAPPAFTPLFQVERVRYPSFVQRAKTRSILEQMRKQKEAGLRFDCVKLLYACSHSNSGFVGWRVGRSSCNDCYYLSLHCSSNNHGSFINQQNPVKQTSSR